MAPITPKLPRRGTRTGEAGSSVPLASNPGEPAQGLWSPGGCDARDASRTPSREGPRAGVSGEDVLGSGPVLGLPAERPGEGERAD